MATSQIEDTITTGRAAKLAGVCTRTVCKWCDLGLLQYSRLPPAGHRRIRRDEFDAFMLRTRMPRGER